MHTPRDTQVLRLLTIVGLTCVLGCPIDEVPIDGETGGDELLAGTLVITEVVANVPGDDEGLEWFEIYNTSSETVTLEGLVLVYEKVDGTGRKTHTVARGVEVASGGYVVVGSLLDELAEGSGHVDYGYAGELGDFGNTAGYLAIESASGDIVDEIYYDAPSETGSRTFDGSQTPDSLANDNLDNWCDSQTELSDGFAATPGAANDVCGSAESCLQDGQPVAIVHPQPGEIVITEVLPNPDFVADDTGEWFELHSLATTDFHLNGLEIGKSIEDAAEDTIAYPECITISPGQYAVVAKTADPMLNGEVPAEVIVWETDISLTNTDGSLWVGIAGELLDVVTWGSAGTGESTQLDPDFFDPAVNDDLLNWCDATEPFNAGDVGTPGLANSECFIAPPEGQCYENGELRDIVPVDMGDLEITELMPNPDAVEDTDGEWFEILVKSNGDLNGLEIGKAGAVEDVVEFGDAPGFASDACIAVTAGQSVVFARSDDPLVNGGLPQVDVLYEMSLNNSSSDLTIGYGGMVWDMAMWTTSSAGASLSKDALANWCDGVDPYGDGDLGTPGTMNPMCGGGPVDGCTDPDTMLPRMFDPPLPGEIQITEVMPDPMGAPDATGEWFEIHATGSFDLNGLELGKTGVISHTVPFEGMCIEILADDYLVFGRSDVDLENCMLPVDYVYDTLTLNNDNGNLQVGHGGMVLSETSWVGSTAGAALSLDSMSMMWCDAQMPFGCGDLGTPGVVNPACGGGGGGQCFDPQLMMMRDPVVPTVGDVVITEFMADPSAVPDADGEWFEVRALASFDLNGLWLGKDYVGEAGNPLHVINPGVDCLSVAPNDVVLFAIDADPMLNGNLPPVDYVYDFGLTNGASGLYIASDVELLDQINWANNTAGRSTSLDSDSYDPMLNNNADAPPWCDMLVDQQTPGADNQQCP